MANQSKGKLVIMSKTFWVNVIAIIAILVQNYLGMDIPAETQVSILAAINVLIRLITKEPVVWGRD